VKRTIQIVLTVILALALFVSMSSAQGIKVAFVDSDIILRDLPEAQKARKEIEETVKGWQEELERMSAEFQKGLEEYQQKQALFNPEKKQAEEKRLAELQQKAREYQMSKFDTQRGELGTVQERKLGPIREKVLEAIEAVAKEEGFSFVFDKVGDAVLLYGDAKFNITYKVLDRLKRGAAVAPKGK